MEKQGLQKMKKIEGIKRQDNLKQKKKKKKNKIKNL
jgi:hypothetical protein